MRFNRICLACEDVKLMIDREGTRVSPWPPFLTVAVPRLFAIGSTSCSAQDNCARRDGDRVAGRRTKRASFQRQLQDLAN
jgi:hypothetical protein